MDSTKHQVKSVICIKTVEDALDKVIIFSKGKQYRFNSTRSDGIYTTINELDEWHLLDTVTEQEWFEQHFIITQNYETAEQINVKYVKDQIERLADYILKEYEYEPGSAGRDEGAADVAIRLLKEYKPSYTKEREEKQSSKGRKPKFYNKSGRRKHTNVDSKLT